MVPPRQIGALMSASGGMASVGEIQPGAARADVAPDVFVDVLGSFRVTFRGELVKLPVKAQALVAYLAANPGMAATRDRLADLAWPRSGPEQARQSLRQALVAVRQALPGAVLASLGPDQVTLKGVRVDLAEFERLAGSGVLAELEQAAGLYRGEFLADSPEFGDSFDAWLAAERARIAGVAGQVLTRLAEAYGAEGRHDDAIASAQRLVALDPLREDGQRLLIACFAEAGRRSEALRQYEACRELLRRELGVAPDAATNALAEDVRKAVRIPLVPRAAALPVGPPAAPTEPAGATPSPAAPAVSVRGRVWLMLVLLLLGAGASALAYRFWPAADGRLSLRLVAFTPLTPDADALAKALTARLTGGIGGIPTVRLLTSFGAAPGGASRGDYVVEGSVSTGGQGAHVEARVTDARSGEVVFTTKFDAPQRESAEMQDEILGRIGDDLTVAINKLSYPHPIDTPARQQALSLVLEARKRVERAEDADLILSEYRQALALDPDNVEILAWYANALIAVTQNNGRAPDRGDARLLEARDILERGEMVAPYHRLIGHARCQLFKLIGEPQTGLVACELTRRIIPWSSRTFKELGYNAMLLGLFEDAATDFQAADRLQKDGAVRWTWYWGAGLVSLLTGKDEQAVEWLSRALRLRTSDPWIHAALAVALRRVKDEVGAQREIETWRSLQPTTTIDDFIANNFPPSIAYNSKVRGVISELRGDLDAVISKVP